MLPLTFTNCGPGPIDFLSFEIEEAVEEDDSGFTAPREPTLTLGDTPSGSESRSEGQLQAFMPMKGAYL